MSNLHVGTIQTLQVDKTVPFGFYLSNGKESVLLHESQITEHIELDDEIEVFLYHDKQGRLSATMVIPKITAETYGWAEVVEIKKGLGVFVDIGIDKDILVSEDFLPLIQKVWPKKGDVLYVTLVTDKQGRLMAKPVTDEIMQTLTVPANEDMYNKNISGRIYRSGRIGAYMISDVGFRCFIHESEQQMKEPRLGEYVEGRVIDVKEDGSLNVSLLPRKQESIGKDAELIIEYLQLNDGSMEFGDKSDPDRIQSTFNMSKGAFKRALGKLMKERIVRQENGITYLIEEKNNTMLT